MPDIRRPLQSLVTDAADFAQGSPEAAAAGQWWLTDPLNQRYRTVSDPASVRHAAVLVLLWSDGGGTHVLLTERSTALAKHPGQVAFPGGAAEEFDVDHAATALREAQEEVGLDPTGVEVIGPLPPALIPVSGFSVTPVLAVTDDLGVLTPHSGEVARVIKAPVVELSDPQSRYTAISVNRGPRVPTPAFLFGDTAGSRTFVWGFTGILLDRLLDRLGWAQQWDPSRQLDPRSFKR